MQYRVTVEKTLTQSGVILVEADSPEAAEDMVRTRMVDRNRPLQTNDPEIQWDEPEVEGGSFTTTGDVEQE